MLFVWKGSNKSKLTRVINALSIHSPLLSKARSLQAIYRSIYSSPSQGLPKGQSATAWMTQNENMQSWFLCQPGATVVPLHLCSSVLLHWPGTSEWNKHFGSVANAVITTDRHLEGVCLAGLSFTVHSLPLVLILPFYSLMGSIQISVQTPTTAFQTATNNDVDQQWWSRSVTVD